MRYMFLIYTNEEATEADSPGGRERIAAAHRAVVEQTASLGLLQGAESLQPTSTATTVRVLNEKVMVTDGPFAETKEQFAGYYILECRDLDEAIEWAARIPTTCGGGKGSIEIRPIRQVVFRSNLSESHTAGAASRND